MGRRVLALAAMVVMLLMLLLLLLLLVLFVILPLLLLLLNLLLLILPQRRSASPSLLRPHRRRLPFLSHRAHPRLRRRNVGPSIYRTRKCARRRQ